MGGGIVEPGAALICDGDDVLEELNRVFGDPDSSKYQHARNHNDFGKIENVKDNYKKLIAAYETAGVPVNHRWAAYLRLLGTVGTQGPQNIYDIAQTRHSSLSNNVGMSTVVHVPKNGGHVHTVHGSKGGSPSSINSPCPLPVERRRDD